MEVHKKVKKGHINELKDPLPKILEKPQVPHVYIFNCCASMFQFHVKEQSVEMATAMHTPPW